MLIGLCTASLVALSFYFLHKRENILFNFSDILFLLLIIFVSSIYKPSKDIFLWVGWSFLLYVAYDDLKTKMYNVLIPISVTLYFLIILKNPYPLIFALFFSLIIWVFSYFLKKNSLGEADAFIFIPLFYIVGLEKTFIFLPLACFWGTIWLVYQLIRKKDNNISFAPFLVFSSLFSFLNWHIEWIFNLSLLFFIISLFIYFIFYISFNKNKEEE